MHSVYLQLRVKQVVDSMNAHEEGAASLFAYVTLQYIATCCNNL